MILLSSTVPATSAKSRWLLIAVLAFPVCPGYAEMSSATSSVSSAVTELQSTADSTQASGSQTLAETVTPFYEKSGSPQNAIKSTPRVGSGSHLLNVTLGLIAIIGLIFALSLFVKRFGSGTFSANTQLKIISSMPLGTRERIVLIDAGGQQLLLGITPTNINTLHVFADPIVVDSKPELQSDFSQKLMAILQQKPSSTSSNNKNDSASQE